MSSNNLYPDGIRVVCNALRTCLSLKVLDLSYNSPGREGALPELLRYHKTLQSIGVIEREPQTRSEKTCASAGERIRNRAPPRVLHC